MISFRSAPRMCVGALLLFGRSTPPAIGETRPHRVVPSVGAGDRCSLQVQHDVQMGLFSGAEVLQGATLALWAAFARTGNTRWLLFPSLGELGRDQQLFVGAAGSGEAGGRGPRARGADRRPKMQVTRYESCRLQAVKVG